MKKTTVLILSVLICGLQGHSARAEAVVRPATEDIQRTKELLEIWKDHVRTLTKERDEAYREIDRLKTQGSASRHSTGLSQFGAVETQPLPDIKSQQMIAGLQNQIRDLTIQNENAQKLSQESALGQADRERLRQLEKDKDKLLKEVDEANRQMNVLRTQSGQTKALQDELASLKSDKEAFLKTHSEMGISYQAAMKEIAETRQMKSVWEKRQAELENQNKALQGEWAAQTQILQDLRAQFQNFKSRLQNLASGLDESKSS